MKRYAIVLVLVALSVAAVSASSAQPGGMGGMEMKNTNTMGKDDQRKGSEKASQSGLYKGVGTVTTVDAASGKVTIAHGPIAALKWPAMTMTYEVKDKQLLEKLSTGEKVEFEFVQRGSDYIITSAKST
ncbi:MAG: copper-binding protein [Burkholderiales bacterium]